MKFKCPVKKKEPTSLDEIMGSFHKTLSQLSVFQVNTQAAIDKNEDRIVELETETDALVGEMAQAAVIANRLRELVGEA